MNRDERTRLHAILSCQSESGAEGRIAALATALLRDAGCRVWRDEAGNVYATKGRTKHHPTALLVAHMDTVHDIVPDSRYRVLAEVDGGDLIYRAYDPTSGKWRGVGGDDKAGVWVATEIARREPHARVLLTVDEERGAIGAALADRAFVTRSAAMIQADRRGHDEIITATYGAAIACDDLSAIAEAAGRPSGRALSRRGGLSDVTELAELTRVSGVNIAAGYDRPHTAAETLSSDSAEAALEAAHAIAREVRGHQFRLPEIVRPPYVARAKSGRDWYDNDDWAAVRAAYQTTVSTPPARWCKTCLRRMHGTECAWCAAEAAIAEAEAAQDERQPWGWLCDCPTSPGPEDATCTDCGMPQPGYGWIGSDR